MCNIDLFYRLNKLLLLFRRVVSSLTLHQSYVSAFITSDASKSLIAISQYLSAIENPEAR